MITGIAIKTIMCVALYIFVVCIIYEGRVNRLTCSVVLYRMKITTACLNVL